MLQQNARLIQFEVQEKERKQIASELHDNILNRLSMALSLFRDDFIDTEKFKTNLKSIANDIRHTQLVYIPIGLRNLQFKNTSKNRFMNYQN